ncbi:MAG: PKD domain-containing protein [Chitinophagaceae bacterium]
MKNSLRAGILVLFSILLFGADVCAQITAAFTFTPASGCSPQVVSFTNTSSGSYSSSSWSFGNSTSSTLTNPSTSYTSPGTYTVTLTVSGTSGSKSVSHTVIIYPAPTVSLSFTPSLGCDPVNVSFTPTVTPGTPGSVTYYWDFGDGLNSTNTNPSHAYSTSSSTSSTYTPKVTVTNSQGCSTTFISTNTVTVNARPQGSFTANPANNCNLPAIVGFSNSVTGNGPFTVGWTFGDMGTATGNGPTHVYNGAGKYDVVMYMTDANGCKDSVVKKKYVSVKANNASFTGPAIGCDSTSVSFTNTTPGSSASTWDFGDGTGYFYGSTAAHYFTAAGVYTVMLLSTDSSCLDTVRHTITIQPKPIIWITNDTPCQTPATYTFTGKSNTPGMTYTWSFASGGTATGTTATHYYPIGTIESATLIGTSPGGCIDTFKNDSLLIYDAFIFGGTRPKGGCVPLTVVFNADLYSSIPYTPWKIGAYGPYPSKTVSWHWVFDGNPTLTSNDSTPSFTFTTTGIHYATLTITTANGCTFTSVIQVPVGDKMPPSFTGGPDTTCVRQLIHLQNTTADTSITFYWRWGNGDETGQVQGDYFYRRPGTFTVTLISDWNGCYDSVSRQNLITILPSDANFNDSIYCWPSLTVNFTDISIGATTHLWVFGDGSPNTTVQSPQHIYPGPGKYPATQITWNSTYGCRDTVTDTIRIIPINLDFKASDTTLCQRDTLHLTASYSGPNEHLWAWSIDGLINPSDSVNQVFKDSMLPNTGYHTVKLFLVTYKRCRDSVVKNNYIIVSHPVAGFSATPTIGCAPLTVTFKDTTAFTPGTALGNSYWRFGNGDTARNSNVYTTAYYPLDGIYTVKFVVTDWNGCPDSVFKVGYIESRKPNAFYQVNALDGCVGNVFNFTNISVGATSNLATYWSFGDGDSANTFNTTHIYKAAGAYTVKMAVFDSTGCSDTMIKTITITRPTAAFSVSDSIAVCPPLIVSFTNGSTGGGKYAWDFKNTATSSVTNPTSTFGTPGVYSVMLVVTDGNGCKDTATHTVRVLGYSGAFDYPEKIGCNPLTVHFTSKIVNVADSVIWDFADGTTLSGTGLTSMHTYLNPGAYVPKLIFSDKKSGCKASSIGLDTIKVDAVRAGFKALPPCEKTAIQLVDTSFSYFSAMKDWRWNFGTAGSAIGNPVNRIYNSAGQYPVTLIATNATGCKDTLTRMITIYPLPIVVAMDDTAVCIPDAITLFASGAKTYTWAPPTFLSCTGCPNPLASPNVPISYIVTGTDSIGCQNIDTVKVGIQTKTTFVVADKGEICLGDTIRLFAAGATIYNWAPPDGLDSPNIAKPMASPKTNTTYIVTAKEGSCLASTHSVQVTVHPLPTVDAGGDLKVIAGRAVLLQASGTGIARVKWRDDSTLSCLECFAPEAKPRVTTTYQITAYTEFGCTSTDSMTVVVLCDGSQLFIPNTFSPNGDGHNDVFFPRGDGIKIIKSFRIYSRWGELMYSKENVRVNDESAGWDGIHNGKILTPDVFVYVLEASCDTGEPIIFKGDVTLLK